MDIYVHVQTRGLVVITQKYKSTCLCQQTTVCVCVCVSACVCTCVGLYATWEMVCTATSLKCQFVTSRVPSNEFCQFSSAHNNGTAIQISLLFQHYKYQGIK